MPAPTFRVVGGAYRRRHTQVPPYEHGRTAPFCWGAGTSSDTVRHKAAVHHPVRGGRRPCGIRRGDCAICGWRFGRLWISPAAADDRGCCLWTPRFGQRAAGWQEVSARNFVSEQGPGSPPYWMYGKKLGRSYGAKGPATPAVTPVVSCSIEKIE